MTMFANQPLRANDLVLIDNREFRIADVTASGVVLQSLDQLEENISKTNAEMLKLKSSPSFKILKGYFDEKRAINRCAGPTKFLESLNDQQNLKLNFDIELVEHCLEKIDEGSMTLSDASMDRAKPAIKEHMEAWSLQGKTPRAGRAVSIYPIPCNKILRGMINAYRDAGRDLFALLPKQSTRPPKKRMCREVYRIMRSVVAKDYPTNQRPNGSIVVKNVMAAIDAANKTRVAEGLNPLDYPSERSIYREIESLDPYELAVQRHGKAKANAKFGLVESGLQVRFPLERIEIDEWQLDVRNLAIDSGRAVGLSPKQLRALERVRRWAVVAIDCATRCILALIITDKPSREATLKVIEQITFDKTQIAQDYGCKFPWHQHGRPGLIVMDNGSAFTPVRIRAAIAAIGADVMYAPAGVPKLRGRIERFFGTATRQLMPELPGRTFANPKERGDYDSDAMACLTDDEVSSVLTMQIVDIYNQSPHEGLKGETPAACWDRLTALYRPDQEVDGYQRREAFGRPIFRKITGRGITVFGIEYASDLVRHLHLHSHLDEVEVRVDTRDLGWITMWYEGQWHPLTAKLDYLNGVHLSEWLVTEKALRAKRREQSRVTGPMVREALDGIRATVAAARLRSNIGPSSLTPQQIASALKEAYLGIKISDQDKQAKSGPTAFATEITEDDWKDDDTATDEQGVSLGTDVDDDNLNDDQDDTTEISK